MQILNIYILSTLSIFLGKVDFFLIPCPIKYLTQIDCPGCGFQRSLIALVQGDLMASFAIYPPTIPFILSAISGIVTIVLKGNTNSKILKIMYIATGVIILVNYMYKIATHQLQ